MQVFDTGVKRLVKWKWLVWLFDHDGRYQFMDQEGWRLKECILWKYHLESWKLKNGANGAS